VAIDHKRGMGKEASRAGFSTELDQHCDADAAS